MINTQHSPDQPVAPGVLGNSAAPLRATGAVVLAGILAVGVCLRVYHIRESLWLDELHTSWTVSGRAADIGHRARMGNNSPLYFYLPWLTTQILPASEWALRLPSVVAGSSMIAVVFWGVLRWTDCPVLALMAAALSALDPHFLFYSLEARPYVLVQLLGMVHVLTFQQLVVRPNAYWRCLWVVGAAGLFYLHYTAILIVASEISYYVAVRIVFRDRPAYRVRRLLVDAGLVAALCAPALDHVMLVASRRSNWEAFVHHRPLWSVLSVFPLSTYVVVPAATVCVVAGARWLRRRHPVLGTVDRRLLTLVCCWLFVPLLITWGTTQTDVARLLFRRYVIVASAAPIFLAAVIGSLCPSRPTRIFFSSAVVGLALITISPLSLWMHEGRVVMRGDEDWRSAVRALNRDGLHRRLPVFVRSGLIEADALRSYHGDPLSDLQAYCRLPVQGLYRVQPPQREVIPLPTADSGHLTSVQWKRIAEAGGSWFLIRGNRALVERVVRQLHVGARQHRLRLAIVSQAEFTRDGARFDAAQERTVRERESRRASTAQRVGVTLLRLLVTRE